MSKAMSAFKDIKLDFWIKHNLNVLMIGKHGVGKTAMVQDAFERHGLKWKYFSASTMDPWVDFVGIPREMKQKTEPAEYKLIRELNSLSERMALNWITNNWRLGEDQAKILINHIMSTSEGVPVLDIVRPKEFANDQIEALFFDEFNRSPKKIRNAVMELIQFRSINGKKFKNLRFVWAAINPDDDDVLNYDVEKLDPAQLDRFQIPVEIPYHPNADWFRKRYDRRLADSAIAWWVELPKEEKDKVSPRRLQYALDIYLERGDMRDVLPPSCNVNKLIQTLKNGPITDRLDSVMNARSIPEAKKMMENENDFDSAIKYILKSTDYLDFYGPLLPNEKISALLDSSEDFCNHAITSISKHPVFHKICKDVMEANQNAKLCKKIRRHLTEFPEVAKMFNEKPNMASNR